MNELHKLIGIVVSPKRAFDAINQTPTWVLPLALLFLFNFLTQFVVFRVIATDANFDEIARAKIAWDSKALGSMPSQSTVEQQLNGLRRARKYWYLAPFIGVPFSVLPLALYFYIVLRLLKCGTTFRKVFAVFCWSFVIYRCVGGAFVIVTLLIRGAANFFPAPPEAWSPTSLAHVIPRAAVSPHVYSTISKIDFFLIWWLAVLAIGFSRTSKNLSLANSAILVAVSEAAYLTLNVVGWVP